jgi:Fur family peroxide stress response transcriptional regulator
LKSIEIHPPPLDIGHQLADRGLRLTAQRRVVYAVLAEELDHPTAEAVFLCVKRRLPEISLATVYNCLEALVRCGLARRVVVDPMARRFCPNMAEHGHFYCEECGAVYDVEPGSGRAVDVMALPRGFRALRYEVSIRGICASCAARSNRVPGKRARS